MKFLRSVELMVKRQPPVPALRAHQESRHSKRNQQGAAHGNQGNFKHVYPLCVYIYFT
jgi:hypothetical protein